MIDGVTTRKLRLIPDERDADPTERATHAGRDQFGERSQSETVSLRQIVTDGVDGNMLAIPRGASRSEEGQP